MDDRGQPARGDSTDSLGTRRRRRRPRFRSVLLICAANTARSVMAEHLLRRELEPRGVERGGAGAIGRDRRLTLATAPWFRSIRGWLCATRGSTWTKRRPRPTCGAIRSCCAKPRLVIAMTEAQARRAAREISGRPAAAGLYAASFRRRDRRYRRPVRAGRRGVRRLPRRDQAADPARSRTASMSTPEAD